MVLMSLEMESDVSIPAQELALEVKQLIRIQYFAKQIFSLEQSNRLDGQIRCHEAKNSYLLDAKF